MPARLFLIVGLPGAGKTTRARDLARTHAALRFTPDEWMIPLYGESDPDGKRWVLEARLIWTAARALAIGTNVVLDFGLWSLEERASLHWLADSLGATAQTVYLPVDQQTQVDRIAVRWATTPHETWPMTADDLSRWRAQFDEPDGDELAGRLPASPPAPFAGWAEWIAARWPSSYPIGA